MLIACYERVSTTEQAENGYSLDEQRTRMESYCAAMGWMIFKHYTDGGFSGANTDRPALQAMIRDVQEHRVEIEKIFLASGVDFVSMQENFDTATPFGRAMIGILAVFAQLERETIKERMYMGRQARVKSGKYSGNHPPIGYRYGNGELTVDEYEAMQIRFVFSEFLSGQSPYQIAQTMHDKGYTHSYGAWTERRIRDTLRQRMYIGENSFHGEWYAGTHPAIISRENFDMAQALYKRRSEAHEIKNRRTGKATSLLGGFLICAQCGKKYERTTIHDAKHDRWYHYYECMTRHNRKASARLGLSCSNMIWPEKKLDAAILGEIRKLAFDPSFASWTRDAQTESRADAVKAELKKTEQRIDRLFDLYADADIDASTLTRRLDAENRRRSALQEQLDTIALEKEKRARNDLSAFALSSVPDALEAGSPADLRKIVETLVDYIEIDSADISVHWNL